ncbi:MAG: hypothetical protein LBR81_03395, partial [Prevotellaceae bacterium]|nr:hypothetical protein [Prevotellaceae bacterium]
MKKTLLLTITLLSVCTLFAQNYQSLDLKNPIQFSGNKIIYNSETITLDEHNIFLAGNLSDEEIKGKSFVFNNFADAVAYFDTDTVEVLRATPLQYTIYIAPFVYWIDNPDDPEIRKPNPDDTKKYGRARPYGMTIKTNNLHLRGLTENPENIVLASNRGQTQGAEGNFTMFHFLGDDLKVSNLTMGNYCNVDLEFPLKPELNRTKRNNAIVQAQIAICEGDRIWAESVRFISRLNLNPLSTQKRSFFHNCYFESTDDALAPTGVYLGCIFKFFSSKPFAQTRGAGAVILDSDIYIVGKRKTQYMVKRNSPLALVDVRFHADDDSVQIGWIQKTDI